MRRIGPLNFDPMFHFDTLAFDHSDSWPLTFASSLVVFTVQFCLPLLATTALYLRIYGRLRTRRAARRKRLDNRRNTSLSTPPSRVTLPEKVAMRGGNGSDRRSSGVAWHREEIETRSLQRLNGGHAKVAGKRSRASHLGESGSKEVKREGHKSGRVTSVLRSKRERRRVRRGHVFSVSRSYQRLNGEHARVAGKEAASLLK